MYTFCEKSGVCKYGLAVKHHLHWYKHWYCNRYYMISRCNVFETLILECSDEAHWFTCSNGQCLPRHMLCDGYLHCEDGSDEVELCGKDWCTARPLKNIPWTIQIVLFCFVHTIVDSWEFACGFINFSQTGLPNVGEANPIDSLTD